MSRTPTLVVEDPTASATIDNIGKTPFILTAQWANGRLRIVVEQPKCALPWPKHEFEVPLLDSDLDESQEEHP